MGESVHKLDWRVSTTYNETLNNSTPELEAIQLYQHSPDSPRPELVSLANRARISKAVFPQSRESATGSQLRTEPELVLSPHTLALFHTNLIKYSQPGHISLTWWFTITDLLKGHTEVCGMLGNNHAPSSAVHQIHWPDSICSSLGQFTKPRAGFWLVKYPGKNSTQADCWLLAINFQNYSGSYQQPTPDHHLSHSCCLYHKAVWLLLTEFHSTFHACSYRSCGKMHS